MNATLSNGRNVHPGDSVELFVKPLRRWGAKYREDVKADVVRAKGIVTSITFEKNPDTEVIYWTGKALVYIPLIKADGARAGEFYCERTFTNISAK